MREKSRLRFLLLRLGKSKLRNKTLSVANSAATAGRAVMSQSVLDRVGTMMGTRGAQAPSHNVATWEPSPAQPEVRDLYFKFKPPTTRPIHFLF